MSALGRLLHALRVWLMPEGLHDVGLTNDDEGDEG